MRLRERSRRVDGWRRRLSAIGLLFALGCGGGNAPTVAPPQTETPADEILRISANWISVQPVKALLSPPSPISVIRGSVTSRVHLTKRDAEEELTIAEDVELRSGARVVCESTFRHPISLRYGWKGGEAAVEITRPPLNGRRACQGRHPEPDLVAESIATLFVLRSDQLIAVEPKTDGRSYIPES